MDRARYTKFRTLPGQSALAFGLAQRCDQVGQCCAIHASAGLHSGDAEGCGQVRLACSRWPKEVDDLGPPDKVKLGQSRNPFSVERRLEAEVEAFKRLDRQELGGAQGHVYPARLPCCVFLAQERVDGLNRRDLAFLKRL